MHSGVRRGSMGVTLIGGPALKSTKVAWAHVTSGFFPGAGRSSAAEFVA
jgi:hypothetical protein